MKKPSQFVVVDDDPINNMICKYNIANFAPAAAIELFTDATKAYLWIQNKYPQTDDGQTALFLDINMPVMDGWEFLDEFRLLPNDVHRQITIFILSSSIDPEDKKKASEHPFISGYYSKPLSKETLKEIYKQY